jgi:hypothetical protein
MNSERHGSCVIVERYNFFFGQTTLMGLISMLWVGLKVYLTMLGNKQDPKEDINHNLV